MGFDINHQRQTSASRFVHKIRASAVCSALACLGMAWSANAAPGDSAQQPLVVAFQGGADSLDPVSRSVTVAYSWQRHIFDTIVHLDNNGTLGPRIATAWESINPNQWKLTIREGVKFHDGTPMTAEDVGLSIMDTLKNPISQMQVYVSGVSGYEVVDDHTLLVNFDVPNPVFPVSLTNVVVMPEKMIEEMGRDKFMTNPIGTGPYKFVKWQTDDYLELTAWEGFWGDQPDFKHVRLQKIPNNSTRVASLISGESQVTEGIAPSDFERIRGDDSLKIEMDPGRRIMYLGLDYHDGVSPGTNVKDKNPFMDPNVRKAISLGIDRELIASKLFDGAVAVSAQFLPPSSAAFNKDVAPIPYDPKQSKELLEKAGYKDGLTVRLDSPNDRYMYDSLVAQAIGGFLKKADVKVDVEAVPMTVYLSSVLRKFNSSMYLLGWGNTASLSTWKSVFHCPDASKGLGVMNFIRYCNPKADAIINEAANTFDSDKRNDLIRQAYAIAIEEDYAYLPLYFQSEVGAMNKHIVWKPRPDGIVLSWEMESKY